ncbi:hypothetical protein ACI1TN_10095 [Lactococcus garvieae]|uniref:hypothetical protein n=1 Tax=Lactococcus garvieae TaxID=1363 RepID=UPI003854A96A
MKKFNIKDIDIEVYTETNKDGLIYGNMVDFNEVRQFNMDDILDSLDIYFPWGEELNIEEYFTFINQTIFLEYPELLTQSDSNLIDMAVVQQGSSIYNIVLQFPERDDTGMDFIINEIFDFCEVPKGTIYEDSLPVELQFWSQYNDQDDYELYRNVPLSFESHIRTIEAINNKIIEFSDHIIKKSLILSALSTSEYLLKSVIVNQTSDIVISHEFAHKIFTDTLNKKLRGSINEIREVFYNLYGYHAPIMDWAPVRNALAHEMENTEIYEDTIKYKHLKKDIIEECSIEELIQKQRNFNNELKNIIIEYNK